MRPNTLLLTAAAASLFISCSSSSRPPPINLPPPAHQTGPTIQIFQYGEPLTLQGSTLRVGDTIPDASFKTPKGGDLRLHELTGKTLLISVVPELGTSICDRSSQRFDQLSLNQPRDVVVIVVSADDPFTQDRWQREHGTHRIQLLSDSVDGSFGLAAGLRIKETGRLARCIFVVDRQGQIRYIELQRELARDPDYNAAMRALGGARREK